MMMRRSMIVGAVVGLIGAACVVVFADGPVYVERPASSSPVTTTTPANNSTARGVAELMARSRSCRHFGGNAGYEGVGMGSTPEAALGNCCYSRSGMRVVDQGVAFGGGRWWACKRYR